MKSTGICPSGAKSGLLYLYFMYYILAYWFENPKYSLKSSENILNFNPGNFRLVLVLDIFDALSLHPFPVSITSDSIIILFPI